MDEPVEVLVFDKKKKRKEKEKKGKKEWRKEKKKDIREKKKKNEIKQSLITRLVTSFLYMHIFERVGRLFSPIAPLLFYSQKSAFL